MSDLPGGIDLVLPSPSTSTGERLLERLRASAEHTFERSWNSLLTDEGEFDMEHDGEAIESMCRDMERVAELIRELTNIITRYST